MRLVSLLILFLAKPYVEGKSAQSTVVLTRSVDTSFITTDLNSTPACNFSGTITLSHPQSIDIDDRHFTVGSLSLHAVEMTVDHINTERCGITVGGLNYSITLRTYGDNSNADKHAAIGRAIVGNTDFMLSGYSSALTQHLSPIAQANDKVLVAGGSSRTSVFENRDHVFGILPPGSTFLAGTFAALSASGGKTVASISEAGTSTCSTVEEYANQYGFELLATEEVIENPKDEDFDLVAKKMSVLDPDIMITCVFSLGCPKWIKAMRGAGWSPKAQVFTVCAGSSDLEDNVGNDLAYTMGASTWDRALPPIPDESTGWTPEKFASSFEETTFQPTLYQHVAAAASVSVVAQAIERADSIEARKVRDQLAEGTFHTMYGETSFDDNGQGKVASLLLQYDETGGLHVVYPPDRVSSEMKIVYPMPTWDQRDCVSISSCRNTNGTCLPSGTCSCIEPFVSIGKGPTASCKDVPLEDMTYISDTLINIGIALVAIQGLFSTLFVCWAIRYRDRPIVKASQPVFLTLIAFGCLLTASAIIPLTFQGGYRYEQDPVTGLLTDEPNKDIAKLDAACMAFPWLYAMGIGLIFATLFAKILRVKKILQNSSAYRRRVVKMKDVLLIMVAVLAIEISILLSWQLISPLRWERDVLVSDEDGYPLQSVGQCKSKYAYAFSFVLASVHLASLLYSLWLCYVTRHIPSDFAEGKWITISIASIFQTLLLGIPVLVIANNNRNADFFVRMAMVFLVSAIVTVLIFVPKFKRFLIPETPAGSTIMTTSRTNISRRNSDKLSKSLKRYALDKSKSNRSSFPSPRNPSFEELNRQNMTKFQVWESESVKFEQSSASCAELSDSTLRQNRTPRNVSLNFVDGDISKSCNPNQMSSLTLESIKKSTSILIEKLEEDDVSNDDNC